MVSSNHPGVLVSIDGELTAPEHATISVFDRSFLFGDSIYETMRTYRGGQLFALDAHLRRLAESAARVHMPLPTPLARAGAWCRDAVAATDNPESLARIVLTRGGTIDYGLNRDLDTPGRVIILVRPFEPVPPTLYADGVSLIVAEVRRNPPEALDPAIKSGNYLNSILAAIEAHRAGAYDAIFLDLHGHVAEATTSSVFLVAGSPEAPTLHTPPLTTGILDSITRRLVLRAAGRIGLTTDDQAPVPRAALLSARELFLASTTKEVLPITRLDDLPIGDGRPGPVTRRLHEALRDEVQRTLDVANAETLP